MKPTSKPLTVIDIEAIAKLNANVSCQRLAVHALPNCDTVTFIWGIIT